MMKELQTLQLNFHYPELYSSEHVELQTISLPPAFCEPLGREAPDSRLAFPPTGDLQAPDAEGAAALEMPRSPRLLIKASLVQ